MQRLTFHRYLERYVRSLSQSGTNSISKLAREVPENPRLREPLFLYALTFGKVALLLKATHGCPVCSEYFDMAKRYTLEKLMNALEERDMSLGWEYHKTYRSYLSRRNMPDTDRDTKLLMHKKIRGLQERKSVSNYRIYVDLKLNPSNANRFLKNGDSTKVSMKVAEKMLEYLEAV